MKPLFLFLNKLITMGSLTWVESNGKIHTFKGKEPGPDVKLISKDKKLEWRLFLNPQLALPEAYMDGRLEIIVNGERTFSKPLLKLLQSNVAKFNYEYKFGIMNLIARPVNFIKTYNTIALSSKRVRHHYDVGNDFYKKWLDNDMMYSCAYFKSGKKTLEEAQYDKKEHIRKKLDLKDGEKVLDIGCGWGGMAIHLAQKNNVHVTGISLSPEQLKIAKERAEKLQISDKVEFKLCDYRDLKEKFDKIVSIGMLEHVGKSKLNLYFNCVSNLLDKDGLALIHTISNKRKISDAGPFIRKYIFPGGYIPTLTDLSKSVTNSGLWMQDLEIWRLHYAKTLEHWHERFIRNKKEVIENYDENFFRMWEFYLSGSETFFSLGAGIVAQIQLGHNRDSAPLDRDYINMQ
tara:strand:+ start:126 stop:1334 length:1209 start_codon:yes stop_codon:yes gene_type:complete